MHRMLSSMKTTKLGAKFLRKIIFLLKIFDPIQKSKSLITKWIIRTGSKQAEPILGPCLIVIESFSDRNYFFEPIQKLVRTDRNPTLNFTIGRFTLNDLECSEIFKD